MLKELSPPKEGSPLHTQRWEERGLSQEEDHKEWHVATFSQRGQEAILTSSGDCGSKSDPLPPEDHGASDLATAVNLPCVGVKPGLPPLQYGYGILQLVGFHHQSAMGGI